MQTLQLETERLISFCRSASGNTQIEGTLTADGHTELNSTLNVDSNTTLGAQLTVELVTQSSMEL